MSDPLVPSEVDLRDFAYMPLDVLRLRDSDLAAEATDAEFRAAVMLWCASWHQLPAASLPDNDAVLTRLSGFGRDIKGWKSVREGALRGWVKCDDGRLYHAVVAEKANEAWYQKQKQRARTAAARAARLSQSASSHTTGNVTTPVTENVTSSKGTERNGTELKKEVRDADASLVDEPVDLTRKRIERSQSDQALLDRITDRWNAWAKPRGCPSVALLTTSRGQHCRKRIDDLKAMTGTVTPEEAFDRLLTKCEASFFIRGSPRSKLKFNQLMREGFMAEMMEGGFEFEERSRRQWHG